MIGVTSMHTDALKRVKAHATAGLAVREEFFALNSELLVEIAKRISENLSNDSKILFCGNGGSAADCQHLSAELVNRFRIERRPLAGLALTTDSSILTAIGNDYSFEEIFSKQIEALGRKNDVLIAISTSGSSANILRAAAVAKEKGLLCIAMTGRTGGALLDIADYTLQVPTKDTALIQEIHIAAGHVLCDLIEYFLFEK